MVKKTMKSKAHAARPPKPASKAMQAIRKKLMIMRDDLARTVNKQKFTDLNIDTGDAADQATASIEKEISFELTDVERGTLDQIEAALRKIDKGSYGLCESCSKPIAKMRLDALPFARYCIACQSSAEQLPEPQETAAEPRPFSEEP